MSVNEFLTDNSRQWCDSKEKRSNRRLPRALSSSIMEKQLLINFFLSLSRFHFLLSSTFTAVISIVKHYTIKNVEMRYHQHAYFHIKEIVYIFMCVYWLRSMLICSLLVIIGIVQFNLIIELQSTMQTLFFRSFLSCSLSR